MATALSEFPRKRDHRQRAHCNPLSDSIIAYPLSPNHVDWSLHYPHYFKPPSEGTAHSREQLAGQEAAVAPDVASAQANKIYLNSLEHPIKYSAQPVERWRHTRSGKADGVIDIIDLGCGFGAMTIRLAELFPDKLVLGLEIREKVSNFVGKKIQALRNSVELAALQTDKVSPSRVEGQVSVGAQTLATVDVDKGNVVKSSEDSGQVITAAVPRSEDSAAAALATGCSYQNCAILRTNAMKFLPNYIRKHSVEKIFILFPDPHFKKAKWRRRIITPQLLSTYAYHLKPQIGLLYFSTDVYDLFEWMKLSCDKHPLFELVEHPEDDPAYAAMFDTTDECKKAIRLNQKLYGAVYKRV